LEGKIKGELRIAVVATDEIQHVAQESSDYVAKDLLALVEWAEREFNYRMEV
jgi:hypothetical protein